MNQRIGRLLGFEEIKSLTMVFSWSFLFAMESIKKMGWGEGLLFQHTKGSVERTYAILVDTCIQLGVNFFSHILIFF